MPVVKPFNGIRYNKSVVKNIAHVVAPPYDVIGPDMQDDLYAKDPNNVIRLILGRMNDTDSDSDNRYTRAGDLFREWLDEGVLVREERKSIYVYAQGYNDGRRKVERIGFLALLGFEKGAKDRVMPHENTLMKPKIDRLNLIRQVRANLSPIFVMYDDAGRAVLKILKKEMARHRSVIDIKVSGVRERLWALSDEKDIAKIERLLAGKDIFIADGHHRYEVARNYSDEIQSQDAPRELKDNSKFLMTYFIGSDEKMLTVYPTHRLIKDIGTLTPEEIEGRLSKYFYIKKSRNLKDMLSKLARVKKSAGFGIYLGDGIYYVIAQKDYKASDSIVKNASKDWKRLDVTILHSFVMKRVLGLREDEENLKYVKDAVECVSSVDKGGYKMAFFLNPTKVSQVKKVAKLGEKMPKKPTYFYPKLLSGLVINKLC